MNGETGLLSSTAWRNLNGIQCIAALILKVLLNHDVFDLAYIIYAGARCNLHAHEQKVQKLAADNLN
jgi:hypothetical protein